MQIKGMTVAVAIMALCCCAAYIPATSAGDSGISDSSCVPSRDAEISEGFSLRLTDADGNDLSDPLFGGEVTIFFDTIDISSGTVYKLKAMLKK